MGGTMDTKRLAEALNIVQHIYNLASASRGAGQIYQDARVMLPRAMSIIREVIDYEKK